MKTILTLLRRILLAGCFTLLFSAGKAQYVTIPDANFATFLQQQFPGCMNGNQMDITCNDILICEELNCSNQYITDLSGIEYFTSLRTLECSYNEITYFAVLPATLYSFTCQNAKLQNLPDMPAKLGWLNCSSNMLTGLPALPDSIRYIDCRGNSITALPDGLPVNLDILEASYNQITSVGILPINLGTLLINNNLLPGLSALPAKLRMLDCSYNSITVLPAMPANLFSLNCANNQLTVLPAMPASLVSLVCSDNQLTSLPAIPNVTELNCSWNKLTGLPVLSSKMLALYCEKNQITSMPVLPASIYQLKCNDNMLSVLPALPDSLQYLYCNDNLLTSLPALPAKITDLLCGYNQLDSLPALPPLLNYLRCDGNRLHTLPALPSKLVNLKADYNQLVTLPPLPPTISILSLAANKLTELPALPEVMQVLYLTGNPDLRCLPPIKKITTDIILDFSIAATGIKCLPGVISHPNIPFKLAIDTMPLCTPLNPSGCDVAWNIYGIVTQDMDNNCNTYQAEPRMHNLKMNLSDKNSQLLEQVYTNGAGKYSFDTKLGVYKVAVDETKLPFTAACPANGFYRDSLYAADSMRISDNFGLRCKSGFDVGAWGVEGRFRPADTASINIGAGDAANFYGAHCAHNVSGTVTVSIHGPVKYLSQAYGARVPNIVTSTYILWNIADFGATDCEKDFDLVMRTDTNAQIGDKVCFTVSVSPTNGDFNPANNTYTFCREVVGSFDPNEKVVSPSGKVDPADGWMDYTVYFQNTGTDTARHIVITDTLSEYLDPTTFELTGYSVLRLTQIAEAGALKFTFANIMLPDSNVNEPASHGYVQYKVKLKDNMPYGLFVKNTAYIYFDFNAPVVTNTTVNETGVDITAVDSNEPENRNTVNLFPNPANNVLYIATTGKAEWAAVYDMNGRKVSEAQFVTNLLQLSIASLPAGVYFVEVKNGEEVTRKKFIKQ